MASIPAVLDDVLAGSDIEVAFFLDGNPYVVLDFIDGASQVTLATTGPIYAALDPVEGASQVLLDCRGSFAATLDPVTGASSVALAIPVSNTAVPEMSADLSLNEPIEIGVMLTGRITVLEAVDVA